MEYDVFISCKSEDYVFAEEIYNYLKENDIQVFLANKELRQIGDSEYRKAISKALKSSYHMIVFASKAEYIDSDWVSYEWDWFVVAKLKHKKQGQIITVLKNVNIDDVNADLWKYENMTFDGYKDTLLSYVETPSYLRRKEEARQREEEKRKALQAKIEEEKRIESIKNEIKENITEYQRYSDNLFLLSKQIVLKQKQIGTLNKKCPVCGKINQLENVYCSVCGWTFNPVFDADSQSDQDHLFVMRSLWKVVKDSDHIRKELEETISEQRTLSQEKEKIIATLQLKLSQNNSLEEELVTVECERDDLKQQLSDLTQKLKSLNDSHISQKKESQHTLLVVKEEQDRLSKTINSLQSELNSKEKEIHSFKMSLNESEYNCHKLSAELNNYKEKELREQQAKAEEERKKAEARCKVEERKIFNVGDVEFVMIRVEGGTFTMGATSEQFKPQKDEKPAHQVVLSTYYVGETPVTQELWNTIMFSNQSYFKGDKLPMEMVSWYDCQEFIRRLNEKTNKRFRLLTEAEWEFAARGGNKCHYTQYSGSDKLNEVAWFDDTKTHPVKSKKCNELGIYDMSGNVWEWCQDGYQRYTFAAQTDPTGWNSSAFRVYRGGSWHSVPWFCRLSCRNYEAPDKRDPLVGFRLALSE